MKSFITLLTALLATPVSSISLHKAMRKINKDDAKFCPINPPAGGRTWTLCEGPQFAPPTPEMQQKGTVASNVMRCTKEMNFQSLCCLDYANFDAYLSTFGPMTLDLAQIPAAPGAQVPGGLAFSKLSYKSRPD